MYYLLDVAIFTLIVVAVVILSWWVADPNRTKLENTLVVGAGFFGATALAIWFRESKGILEPLSLILPVGTVLVLLRHRRQGWLNIKAYASAARDTLFGLGRLEKILALYLLAVFVLTFVLTLAPPTGNDYDSLVYHLAAPRQYLRMGHVTELPYDHHTYFPFTMEMLYLLGLWLRGPVLAKLFDWLMLPISCLSLVAIGRRHLTLRAGLLAAALFASIPVVQCEASTAYIDLGLTAFSLLAFLCFSNWLALRERRWLLWCGVYCGFCLGTKYLGVLTFAWLGLWAIGSMVKQRDWDLRALGLYAGWALFLGSGWYVRNWLWTGNPVFPFAYGVFGGRGWTAEMAKAYAADQVVYGFGRSFVDWLWLPWRVAMTPLNYAQPYWPLSPAPITNGTLGRFEVEGHLLQTIVGPALLALGAPLLLIRHKPMVVRFVLWSSLFFWIFWAATSQQLRYLLPAFAILCIACGWGAAQYLQRAAILKWTLLATLTCWLLFGLSYTAFSARRSWPVIAGKVTPAEYLNRNFSAYGAMDWASTQTPADARFAVYGEPRCYYLKRDYFWADDPHNNLIDYSRARTGAGLVRELQRLGATYVLANDDLTLGVANGGVFAPPAQLDDAVEKGLLQPVFEFNGYRIYEILKQPRGHAVSKKTPASQTAPVVDATTVELGSAARGRLLAVLVTVYCVLTLLLITRVPVSQAPDEGAHFDYVAYLAEHGTPPVFQKVQAPSYGYEFHQPPLYYALCAPLWKLSGAPAQKYLCRGVSLVCGSLTLLLLWYAALALFPDTAWPAALSTGFAALWPLHQGIGAAGGNDALAGLCCAGMLWAVARGARHPWQWRDSMLVGLFFGLGMLSKSTCLTIGLAASGAAWALASRRQSTAAMQNRSEPTAVLAALTVLGVTVGLSGWWLARNQLLYGDPLAAGAFDAAFRNSSPGPAAFFASGMPVTTYFRALWLILFSTFFGFFGGPNTALDILRPFSTRGPLPAALPLLPLMLICAAATIIAGVGLMRRGGTELEDNALNPYRYVVVGIGTALVVLALCRFNVNHFQAQARYLHPAMLPIALLFGLGWQRRLSAGRNRLTWLGIAIFSATLLALTLCNVFEWRTLVETKAA